MISFLYVSLGGAIGAALRHVVGIAVAARVDGAFPVATLAVNWIGSFAMGVLAALLVRGAVEEPARLLLGVGVLGGFTTFSAFSLDSVRMIERGDWGQFAGYAIASVVGSIFLLMIGAWAARSMTGTGA